MARLRIEFRETQTVVSLKGTETTVGRSNRCTVNLPDPALAEVHFRIQLKSRGYRLKDDGSGIGTLVNGKEVFATTLTHGDVIQAGGVRCVFLERAEDPEAASAPPRRAPRTPTHEAPSVPVRAAAPRRRKSQSQTYVLAGVGLAVVAVVAILLMGRSADQEAHLIWKEAQRSLEASRTDLKGTEAHLEEVVRLLEELRREYPGARVSRTAGISLDDTRNVLRVLKEVEGEKDAIQRVRDEEAELDAFARLARLRETGHPAVLARVESLESFLKEARKERLLALYREAEERVRTLLNERRFAEADRVWSEFQAGDYFLHQRAEGERTKVRKKTSEEYRKLLRLATRAGDLDARIGMLEASRPVFKGTRHADDLEVRVSALRARRTQREIVVLNERKPPTKTEKPTREEDKPEEIPTGPYEDPPKVAELVRQRRYGEAASLLNSITRHPAAKVRTEELTLLANLMADLVAAVRARPQEFDKVLLPGGVGRGDAVDADARFLKIRKAGKETRYPWSDLPAKSYVRLFRQAGFEKPPRLAAAVFFDEESLPREAQQAYVAFFRSELAPTTLTRILARRRGIDPPGGGFQLFRGQLVTTDERDAILLGEEVEKLGKKGLSTNERLRLKAWADLEALGLPAVETLTRVIRERRELVAGELKKSKAFTPTRFASRFGKELAQRRKDALKFI
ncbi:MAG: FHA domain-containing protein, partial [Planctomycetota bacterium]